MKLIERPESQVKKKPTPTAIKKKTPPHQSPPLQYSTQAANAISHPKSQTPPAAASLPLPPSDPNGVVIEGDVVAPFRLRRRLHPLGVFRGRHLRPLHPSHLEVRLFTPNHRRTPQSRPLPSLSPSPKFYIYFFLLNLRSDSLCVRRYVLQNPRCSDLDGVPSLPAAAYALLRQKFRPTTSTLTAAADSKDRTTTKLLISLQVICAFTNVACLHVACESMQSTGVWGLCVIGNML